MGDNFRENIMLTIKLFDALISPILLYESEIKGVDLLFTSKIRQLWIPRRGQHLILRFLAYSLKVDTPESFIVNFFHN